MKFILLSLSLIFLTNCGSQGYAPNLIAVPGPKGDTGATGPTGSPGQNANPVTVVQLCPNSTAHYPNVFVEEALCINKQLYAVYSIPNAFLTVLTPGAYRSDAIGSACNFTVTQNTCVLSY